MPTRGTGLRPRPADSYLAGCQSAPCLAWHPAPGAPLHPPIGKAPVFPHGTYYQQYRLPLHLVVTAKKDPNIRPRMEWHLVTNLAAEDLRHVPRLYGQRRSPSETHSAGAPQPRGSKLCHLGLMRAGRGGTVFPQDRTTMLAYPR